MGNRMLNFTPKIVTTLREGYNFSLYKSDSIAGLTVAIVALPLSMALAIASGASPDKGLVTAVVAGILISVLGSSRVQVGGPTGAFVVVIFNVIALHGYDGLLIATFMAGLILVAAGAFRLGRFGNDCRAQTICSQMAGVLDCGSDNINCCRTAQSTR